MTDEPELAFHAETLPKVTRPKKPKPPPPTFYDVVESFISKHDGADRVSQEFEHLCTRLRTSDPEWVAGFAALQLSTVVIAMQFAYRLLQQNINEE